MASTHAHAVNDAVPANNWEDPGSATERPTIHFTFPAKPPVLNKTAGQHQTSEPWMDSDEEEDLLTCCIQLPSRSRYTRRDPHKLEQPKRLAEIPFFIAAFGSIYSTLMLVRALAVRGWLVDHRHWDGTGHDFDKSPMKNIPLLEHVFVSLGLCCGVAIILCLIARTRFRFYGASCCCQWLAYIQAILCVSSVYHFHCQVNNVSSLFAYSRGFWSCFVSSTLAMVAGVGFTLDWFLDYPSSSLSVVLKGTVLPTTMACATVAIGALVYMRLENWSYNEAFIFCSTALTTIGYGDVAPVTKNGRVFFMIYGIFGVSVVAYFLLSIRAVIAGTSPNIMTVKLMRAESLSEYTQKQRQKWLHQQQTTPLRSNDVDIRCVERSQDSHHCRSLSNMSAFSNFTFSGMLRDKSREVLIQVMTRSGVIRMFIIFTVSWFGGAAIFCYLEDHWSYMDALYFVLTTQLTIGFGDLVPETALAQEFWFIYIILAIAIAAYFISLFGDLLTEKLQLQDEDDDDNEGDGSNDDHDPELDENNEAEYRMQLWTWHQPLQFSRHPSIVSPATPCLSSSPDEIKPLSDSPNASSPQLGNTPALSATHPPSTLATRSYKPTSIMNPLLRTSSQPSYGALASSLTWSLPERETQNNRFKDLVSLSNRPDPIQVTKALLCCQRKKWI
ncbi:uncharacterized protein BYT42DRAFT_581054 [Radiomyces spectabilis]|uniref:uncharacterized protein n=1 Tax=Radiomyces spectabilis TaxID=64574 RepID=UPI0022211B20|nr:uncharacterized protein BYT42DRAFT_581054 [Radiomyces spectabilis]KAI8371669.1 hypothetical protein BYT42DRAFT_581054 [Radiomyces spectabilis]